MNEISTTTENQSVQPQPALVQISQGALDGLIASSKREAAEKARQQALADIEKVKEEARAVAKAETEKQFQEMHIQHQKETQAAKQRELDTAQEQIKSKLIPKFEEGRKKYTDWQDTVLSYDWQKPEFSEILPLLAQDEIDNADEVLHHICNDGHVEKLAHRNKAHVMSKLKEISQSLKSVKEKSHDTVDTVVEPIKPLKPSYVKTKGDDAYTIEDFRKASWLKG